MLRIDIVHEAELTSFTLEGKLAGRWVSELQTCWEAEALAQSRGPILMNLAAVTFVDSDGRELLARMRRTGVTLLPTGCLMKAIVENIETEISKAPAEDAAAGQDERGAC